jgi:hypothetical protein
LMRKSTKTVMQGKAASPLSLSRPLATWATIHFGQERLYR